MFEAGMKRREFEGAPPKRLFLDHQVPHTGQSPRKATKNQCSSRCAKLVEFWAPLSCYQDGTSQRQYRQCGIGFTRKGWELIDQSFARFSLLGTDLHDSGDSAFKSPCPELSDKLLFTSKRQSYRLPGEATKNARWKAEVLGKKTGTCSYALYPFISFHLIAWSSKSDCRPRRTRSFILNRLRLAHQWLRWWAARCDVKGTQFPRCGPSFEFQACLGKKARDNGIRFVKKITNLCTTAAAFNRQRDRFPSSRNNAKQKRERVKSRNLFLTHLAQQECPQSLRDLPFVCCLSGFPFEIVLLCQLTARRAGYEGLSASWLAARCLCAEFEESAAVRAPKADAFDEWRRDFQCGPIFTINASHKRWRQEFPCGLCPGGLRPVVTQRANSRLMSHHRKAFWFVFANDFDMKMHLKTIWNYPSY